MKSRFYDKIQLEGNYIDLDYGYYTQNQLATMLPNGIFSVNVARHTEVTVYAENSFMGLRYVISNISNKSKKIPGFESELNTQTVKSIKIGCACRIDNDPYVSYEIFNQTFIRNNVTLSYSYFSVIPAQPITQYDPPPSYNPTVIIIPDAGLSKDIYACLQDELAQKRFSSIILDIRGTGLSTASSDVTYMTIIQDYRTIIQELGLDTKKPILFGHGIGGAIAQLWALTFRYELRNLILVGTAPYSIFSLYNQLLTETQEWLTGVMNISMYSMVVADTVYNTESKDCQNSKLKQDLIQSYASADESTFKLLFTQNPDDTTMAKAPKFMPVPTLIIHGTLDEFIAFSGAEALYALIPDVELVKIRTGHSPFLSKPNPTYEAIFRFLSPEGKLYI